MSPWGALGPGTRVLALVAGGAVVAGGGYLVWQSTRPVEVSAPTEAVPQVAVVADETAAAAKPADPATAPQARPAVLPQRNLPGIDTWRVAPDGEALVAGIAVPMAVVAVLVDGVKVAEGAATASGEFALQFTLAPNPAPSLMTLSMTEPGKTAAVSDEIVALGPIAGPIAGPETAKPQPNARVAAGDGAATGTDLAVAGTREAPVLPDALLLTKEGAVVLQVDTPADPSLMSQVMIDTITYTPAGAVQVGGRGTAGLTVRIYLDNVEVAVVAVPKGGLWVATLGDTAPGIYTLRVDQLSAEGEVTSRFETPFQRETLEALALAAAPAGDTAIAAALAEPLPVVAPGEPAPAVAALPEPAPELAAEPAPKPVVAEKPAPAPAPAAPAVLAKATAEPAPPVSVTVQPGFTLWGIAQERLGDGVLYVQVFEANRDKIKNPDLIYPGQVLSFPATP